MSQWPSSKANRVLAALRRQGWRVKHRSSGSHCVLEHAYYLDFIWSFHEREELGPRMLARVAKKTGLKPEDL